MRINTQLKALSIGTMMLVMVLALALFWVLSEFTKAKEIDDVFGRIRDLYFERVALRDEFYVYRENRAKEVWLLKTKQTKELIKESLTRLSDKKVQSVLATLNSNLDEGVGVFQRVIDNGERLKTEASNHEAFEEVDKRLFSQLLLRSSDFRDEVTTFMRDSESNLERLYKYIVFLTLFLFLILSVVSIVSAIHFSNIIRKRLLPIHNCAQLIVGGDFSHQIEVKGSDEFSDVIIAINTMMDKLRHANIGLAAEVKERKNTESRLIDSARLLQEAQEKLIMREKFASAIFDYTPEMVLLVDAAGVIRRTSKIASAIFGFVMEEMIGKTVEDLMPKIFRLGDGSLREGFAGFPTGRMMGEGGELFALKADGSVFPVEVTLSPFVFSEERFVLVSLIDLTPRKAVEAVMTRYAAIVESTDDAIISKSIDGIVTSWSKGAEKIYGYTKEEMIGQSITALIPEENLDDEKLIIERVKRNESVKSYATIRRRKDGSLINVSTTISPLHDRNGVVIGACSVTHDSTEKMLFESQLIQSNERYSLAASAANLGFWDFDISANTLNWDERMYILYGKEQQDGKVQYELWRSSLHPDDLARAEMELLDAINKDIKFDTEFRIVRSDGKVRHIRAVATIKRDVKGRALQVFGINMDISDIRMNETKLRHLSQLHQAILDGTNYSIISTDLGGVIQTFNQGAEKMLGYSAAEIEGKQTPIIFHDMNEVSARAAVLTQELGIAVVPGFDTFAVKTRLTHQQDDNEWTYVRKDGTRFPVLLSFTALWDKLDSIRGYLGVAVDISERKQAQEQQMQFVKKLTIANEELNNFAYIASHDLKSPLRGIDQLASWIDEELGDSSIGSIKDYLRLMQVRIKRMESLLDDLLSYARFGFSNGAIVTVDTNTLLRDIIDMNSNRKNLHFQIADNMPVLQTWKAPLDLVFRNLIGNAIKHHNKDHGVIAISSKMLNGRVEFSVNDDGPGISPEHHKRVFALFQTLKPRDQVEGSGMGLALIKKVVESLDCTVSLESDGIHGCTFRFTWPIIVNAMGNGK